MLRKKPRSILRMMLRLFLWAFIFSGALAAGTGYYLHKNGLFEPPDLSRLNDPRQSSKMFDEEEILLHEYCVYCREIAKLEDMGHFPSLSVIIEDKNFWTRKTPFDFLGMLRAFYQNLKNRKIQQGASTISQQTARILFAEKELKREWETDSSRDRWWRKFREAWFAILLERHIDRKSILETYLNNAYCGAGRYGVVACSRYWYSGKDPSELNYAESAIIAGLWRSPRFSPFINFKEVLALRNRVLEQMRQQSLISEAEKNDLENRPLPKRDIKEECPARHFTEFVRKQITAQGKLVDQGLKIYTSLNCDWQKAAARALDESMAEMKKRNPELEKDLRGAALLLDATTGAIKVWTQEPSFDESEFLLDQIKRQAGSAFKPFFYAKWLEKGGRLSCQDAGSGPCRLDDSRLGKDGRSILAISMGKGRDRKYIQNFPYEGLPRYIGIAEPLQILTQSRNAGTMSGMAGVRNSRAAARLTKEEILDLALRLGISPPPADPGLTIAIGSIDVSLYDMVRAWTGFMGAKTDPYAVEEIWDASGKITNPEHKSPEKVLDEKVSLAIIRGLRATVELPHGTGQRARKELDFQVMGKTGTATDQNGETTDNWFVGCSRYYCFGAWIGREQKLPIRTTFTPEGKPIQETGGRNSLRVFIETLKTVYKIMPKEKFLEATDPAKPFIFGLTEQSFNKEEPVSEEEDSW